MVTTEGTQCKRVQTCVLDAYVARKRILVGVLAIFAHCALIIPPLIVSLSAQVISCTQPRDSQGSSGELAALAIRVTSDRLWIWQKRLNLEDWMISIALARAVDLRPNTLGNIRWEIGQKCALIRVLHPADYRLPQNEMLEDMEFTIVHELIHLDLARASKFQPSREANRRKEEQTVNRMAADLLKLDPAQRTRRLTWYQQRN